METIVAGSAKRRAFLYESRGWKLAFNGVWVVLMAVVVVVLLLVGAVLFSQTFLTAPNLGQLTWLWLTRAILIPPVVLIIASGGVDLSIGALIGLTTVVAASLAPSLGMTGGVVAALVVALVVGLVNGLVAGGTRIHGAIVTLAAATLARGLALALSGGRVSALGAAGPFASPALPWAALVVSLVLGLAWALIVGRRPAAIDGQVPRQPWLARLLSTGFPYVFSAVMAGVVGVMFAVRLRVGTMTAGTGYEVDVLLVALLGGTALGSLPVGNSLVNIIGGIGAALALALVQNMQALSGVQNTAALDLGKGVVLLVTGLVSYLYYVLVGRLPAGASQPARQKPK